MPRRLPSRKQLVAQKRLSIWIPTQITAPTTLAANALTIAASSSASLLALAPFTIVRTRGLFTFWSDNAGAAETPQGILGTIVVKNTAVLIGASAVPDPLNEATDDWFVYQPFQHQVTRQIGAAGSFNEISTMQYVIDSKAMRKVDTGDDFPIMVRNTSATFGLIFTYTGRCLLKLH